MPERAPGGSVATCNTCGKSIRWATTELGRAMPLDAKSEKRFIVNERGICTAVDTYVSHFATCLHADHHRRSR